MAMSPGFIACLQEAPETIQAWLNADRIMTEHSALDPKTAELAYLAVLAALGLEQGIEFHAAQAKQLGASRAEVLSAILVGIPAAGLHVTESAVAALRPFDEPGNES
ncbi:carboxymuconolactone decarboxylase family protein [Ktedonosporobacter rubrisoli]|uniref:Carboxymuconolactone decarboxylase family protein n=1 Tax=Ktedonosporobacter rubrisoli TaxID=2509675 RepID=A0A4P6JLV7_KTERU|nr:carboxymuconolactone decarboxylase family protein [Ktedonosporobacter rubrisoli]QBD76073.1 carboxymuconolactone decarboxylase family protein [Ktedonosporobacter rubrisoli]